MSSDPMVMKLIEENKALSLRLDSAREALELQRDNFGAEQKQRLDAEAILDAIRKVIERGAVSPSLDVRSDAACAVLDMLRAADRVVERGSTVADGFKALAETGPRQLPTCCSYHRTGGNERSECGGEFLSE